MDHQPDPELRGAGLAWGLGLAGLLAILVGVVSGPLDSARLWQQAEDHFHRQEYSLAIQDYGEILTRQDRAVPHIRLGQIYLVQTRYELAEEEFGRALALDPTNIEALLGVGSVAMGLEDLEQARGFWQKALAVDATHAQAHYLLATAYIAESNWLLARQELEAAIRFPSGNQSADYLLGLLLALEDPEESVAYLSLAGRGRDEDIKKPAQEMVTFLSESVGKEGSATFYARLGEKYLDVEQPILAAEALRRAIIIDPGLDRAQAYLGHIYFLLGGDDRSRAILLAGREKYPDNPLFPFFLAQYYREEEDLAIAEDYLASALALDPQNPAFHAEEGAIAWQNKDYAGAREAYRKATQLAPQNAGFHLLRAEYHLSTLLWIDDGLEAAQAAVALDPQNPLAWEFLGWAHYLKGELGLAVDALQQSLALDPDRASAYFRLGAVLAALGRADEARQAYQRAYDLATSDFWRNRAELSLASLGKTLP